MTQVQVMEVNLPERTRVRAQAESNIQRSQKPHDLRPAIPLWDPTNPAKFPPYEYREYPKMPLLEGNRPIVIDESGGVLVFYEAADEVEFKELNPDLADEIERNSPTRAFTDQLQAKDDELSELRARLKAAGLDAETKPAKKAEANKMSALVNEAPGELDGEKLTKKDEGGGLRDKLPPNPKNNPLKR